MTTPQPHVHADKITQLLTDMTQGVWYRFPGGNWSQLKDSASFGIPEFFKSAEYHIGHEPPQGPERMKLVFEGNAPWRVEPPEGTKYWIVAIDGDVYHYSWTKSQRSKALLAAGLCWKTAADAIAYRDAYRAAAAGEGKS